MNDLVEEYRNLRDYELKLIKERIQVKASGRSDEEILEKIRRIRTTTQLLRRRLEREQDELDRQLSVYSLPAPSIVNVVPIRGNYVSFPNFALMSPAPQPLQAHPQYFYQPRPDWQPYVVMPQQPMQMYQSHLENVDRMCEVEWTRMQANLNNLKRMRRHCRPDNSAMPESNYREKKVRRRIRKRLYYADDYDNSG